MICKYCAKAGDINTKIPSHVDTKLQSDLSGKVKSLHAKCKSVGCFCQHRTGLNTAHK